MVAVQRRFFLYWSLVGSLHKFELKGCTRSTELQIKGFHFLEMFWGRLELLIFTGVRSSAWAQAFRGKGMEVWKE